jgi:hypothetical protein
LKDVNTSGDDDLVELSDDIDDARSQKVESEQHWHVGGGPKLGEHYRRGKLALHIHGRFKFSDGGVCIIVWNPDGRFATSDQDVELPGNDGRSEKSLCLSRLFNRFRMVSGQSSRFDGGKLYGAGPINVAASGKPFIFAENVRFRLV